LNRISNTRIEIRFIAAEQSHPAVMQGIFRGWHTSEVSKVELRATNAPRVESELKSAPRNSPTDPLNPFHEVKMSITGNDSKPVLLCLRRNPDIVPWNRLSRFF